jgi:PiT family inorganic phosphate transporter
MESSLTFTLFVILLAFIFEFTNGFHDAANSIATIVATKVLSPLQAVIWAAFFNCAAFLFFKLSVATTIGSGLVNPDVASPHLIFAALISAISWNLLTWYYGLPSSSSHALIGGIIGAAICKGGIYSLQFFGLTKIMIGILVSPLLGILIGLFLATIITKIFNHPNNKWFKILQLASSAMLSLSHGGNDAQKTMGIISLLLLSSIYQGQEFHIPSWVVLSCYAVMGCGTLAGGWRIVHTMGQKITSLTPILGSAAETGATIVIFAATSLGAPVSTTHTVTGSIAGVGISRGLTGTSWSIMYRIFLTWLITIPATGLIAAALMLLVEKF